jgi:hypothetical protein
MEEQPAIPEVDLPEPDLGVPESQVVLPEPHDVLPESQVVLPGPVADRTPRWRARWALAAFVVTAVITRAITVFLQMRGAGTEGGLIIAGLHIHHMVYGLLILIALTFMFVLFIGEHTRWANRPWPPILFGVGWALVLDEAALILALEDVYWQPLGDLSYWAMGAFAAALLVASFWAPTREDGY